MCALPKRVKIGGSFYKGYKVSVSATPGDYVLDMTLTTACVINGLTVIPDVYGAGDYFKLEHLNANNVRIALIAETVYNVGASAAWQFDFAALERMEPGEKFRLTYTNVAGNALTVYTNLERIR
jgi:hypothetical protein